jgi:hypothetical protein
MKVHLKFNHDTNCSLEALDCPLSAEELNEQIENIIRKFMTQDKYSSRSHLAELMHDEIDYSAILYMATKHVSQQIEQTMMKRMLREFLDRDENI